MPDERAKIIAEINGEIESAISSFNSAIPKLEKSLVRKINLIIKDLDLSPDGSVKSTIANLNKMKSIEREMATAFESSKYLGNVDKYTESYAKVQGLESKYFKKMLTNYSEPSIINSIHAQSVTEVTNALTGSNIVANVIDPVNNLVRQGIESGVGWDDLRGSINAFLTGQDGGTGALSRYTTTITNDSLNTFSRTYENTIANREGMEWYEYVGREMTNTREFCRHLDDKRWFHQSEISGFMKGIIKGYPQTPLYKKTGKPYGMKAETTPKNFTQLAGGWNCGHHAYPVLTELVPKEIRDRFKKTGQTGLDDDDGSTKKWSPSMSKKTANVWSKKSAIKQTTTHTTKKQNIDSLKKDGFDLSKSGIGREYGDGVYLSTDKKTTRFYKDFVGDDSHIINLKVNIRNPYIMDFDKIPYETGGVGIKKNIVKSLPKHVQHDYKKIHTEWEKKINSINKNAPFENRNKYPLPLSENQITSRTKYFSTNKKVLDKISRNNTVNDANAINEALKQNGYDALQINHSGWENFIGGNQLVVFNTKNVVIID